MACPHVVPNSARPHDLLAVPPRCAAGWQSPGHWLPLRALLFRVRPEARVHGKNLHPGGKSYATDVLSGRLSLALSVKGLRAALGNGFAYRHPDRQSQTIGGVK